MLEYKVREKIYKKMYANLGKQFVLVRQKLGLSMEEAAEKYCIGLVTIAKIESGIWSVCMINIVLFLASCYGKAIEWCLVDLDNE